MFRSCLISCFIIVWTCHASLFAKENQKNSYRQKRDTIQRRDPRLRKVPKIPPKGERLRVIFDTDARNEIDDVWAIALAILSPERFKIEGFVAANFDNSRPETGPDSIEASFKTGFFILFKTDTTLLECCLELLVILSNRAKKFENFEINFNF